VKLLINRLTDRQAWGNMKFLAEVMIMNSAYIRLKIGLITYAIKMM